MLETLPITKKNIHEALEVEDSVEFYNLIFSWSLADDRDMYIKKRKNHKTYVSPCQPERAATINIYYNQLNNM